MCITGPVCEWLLEVALWLVSSSLAGRLWTTANAHGSQWWDQKTFACKLKPAPFKMSSTQRDARLLLWRPVCVSGLCRTSVCRWVDVFGANYAQPQMSVSNQNNHRVCFLHRLLLCARLHPPTSSNHSPTSCRIHSFPYFTLVTGDCLRLWRLTNFLKLIFNQGICWTLNWTCPQWWASR